MRKFIAASLCAVALTLAACSGADSGATFAFYSPGGQTEIFYDCLLYTSPSPRD